MELKQFVLLLKIVTLLLSLLKATVSTDVETIEAREGVDLSVTCNGTEAGVEVFWTKNDTDKTRVQDGVQLNFTSINRTDAGVYICTTYNNETKNSTDVEAVNINVLYPSEVKFLNISATELNENDEFTVTCEVDGFPPPRWLIMINETNKILAMNLSGAAGIHVTPVMTASCSDMGTVVCLADNSVTKVDPSLSEKLIVFCSPRPVRDTRFISYAALGDPGVMSLSAEGYPYPNFTWSRADGRPLERDVQTDTELTSSMNISEVQISDFGNYSLRMENTYGVYNAVFQLSAYGAPETPYNLYYSDVTYNSVRLYWTSGYDMGAKQSFIVMKKFEDGYMQVSNELEFDYSGHGVGQNWTYVQKNLASDSEITLTVIAYNGQTSKLPNTGVTFHTLTVPRQSKKVPTIVIVGSAIGGVVIVTGVVVLILFMLRHRRRKYWTKI